MPSAVAIARVVALHQNAAQLEPSALVPLLLEVRAIEALPRGNTCVPNGVQVGTHLAGERPNGFAQVPRALCWVRAQLKAIGNLI